MAVPARSGAGTTGAVEEIAAALLHEIAATRRSKSNWRYIGTGRRLAAGRMGTLYEFPGASGRSARPGRSVELRIGRDTIPASIAGVTEQTLRLRLPLDLGPDAGPARMRHDVVWMLVEQRKQLLGFEDRIPPLAALLLCPAGARTGLASAKEPLDRVIAGLNGDQAAAVAKALDSQLSYIWGPPGTGKTRTLARIAEALFREGRSVLVTAPTNQAVDHLLSAVLERLDGEEAVVEHALLRLGRIVSEELDRRWGDLVDLDRVAGMATEPPRTTDHVEAVTDVLARLNASEADPREEIAVERLRRMLAQDLPHLTSRRAAAWPQTEAARVRLLERARLVATTLHRASLPGQLPRDFDVLIVDEANAAQLPTVLLAAARTRERAVIAGDFRQLPPVVLSRTALASKWLGRDAFEVGGIARAARGGRTHPQVTMLRTQYRMAPVICELVADFAYKKRITTAASRVKNPDGYAPSRFLGDRSLALIDTSPLAVLLDRGRGAGSASRRPLRSNPWHRFVIGRLLYDLCAPGNASGPPPTVAVLTPYRDQIRLLRKAFGQTYGASFLTVHQAVGKEWDIVIFDLPEGDGLRPSPFMRASQMSHTGARLLTVGLSRARDRLVVVADCAYYRRKGLGNAVVGRLLAQLEERATCVSVHDLVRAAPRDRKLVGRNDARQRRKRMGLHRRDSGAQRREDSDRPRKV